MVQQSFESSILDLMNLNESEQKAFAIKWPEHHEAMKAW